MPEKPPIKTIEEMTEEERKARFDYIDSMCPDVPKGDEQDLWYNGDGRE